MSWINRIQIRLLIPVVLLLCGVLLGALDFWLALGESNRLVEEEFRKEAVYKGSDISGTLEFLYVNEHPEIADAVIPRMGADPNLTLALVLDETGTVIHSTSLKLKGRPIESVKTAAGPALIRAVQSNVSNKAGFTKDRDTLYYAYTFLGGGEKGELRPSKNYVLYAEYGLAHMKEKAHAGALERAMKTTLALFVFTTAVWAYFNRVIGRRLKALKEATARIGNGDLSYDAKLEGKDELAQISEAVSFMASDIRQRELKLKEINERLEQKVNERTAELQEANGLLRREIDERRTFAETLSETNAELSALYHVSSSITRSLDLKELLLDVLKVLVSMDAFSEMGAGAVFVVEGESLMLAAELGNSDEFVRLHEGLKVGECVCGSVARHGELIVNTGSVNDPMHTLKYPGMAEHGHVVVPIKYESRVIGVLCLYIQAGAGIDGQKKRLLLSIGNQLGVAISNARLFDETRRLALHDSLTGLPNRRYMGIVFERCIAKAKRCAAPFSVLLLDIDFFKRYNDAKGHSAGDELLRKIAFILKNELREMDVPVRFGGEEFLIILPDAGAEEAMEAAERLRKSIASSTSVTVSIGVYTCECSTISIDDIIKKVDKALYCAKDEGRNRTRRFVEEV